MADSSIFAEVVKLSESFQTDFEARLRLMENLGVLLYTISGISHFSVLSNPTQLSEDKVSKMMGSLVSQIRAQQGHDLKVIYDQIQNTSTAHEVNALVSQLIHTILSIFTRHNKIISKLLGIAQPSVKENQNEELNYKDILLCKTEYPNLKVARNDLLKKFLRIALLTTVATQSKKFEVPLTDQQISRSLDKIQEYRGRFLEMVTGNVLCELRLLRETSDELKALDLFQNVVLNVTNGYVALLIDNHKEMEILLSQAISLVPKDKGQALIRTLGLNKDSSVPHNPRTGVRRDRTDPEMSLQAISMVTQEKSKALEKTQDLGASDNSRKSPHLETAKPAQNETVSRKEVGLVPKDEVSNLVRKIASNEIRYSNVPKKNFKFARQQKTEPASPPPVSEEVPQDEGRVLPPELRVKTALGNKSCYSTVHNQPRKPPRLQKTEPAEMFSRPTAILVPKNEVRVLPSGLRVRSVPVKESCGSNVHDKPCKAGRVKKIVKIVRKKKEEPLRV